MSRVRRNAFVVRWAGREWELRQRSHEIGPQVAAARRNDEVDAYTIGTGQTAGLIHDLKPAGQVVQDVAREAEDIIRTRLATLVKEPSSV